MDWRIYRVAVRMWFWAALLRVLKHVLSLDTLVRLAHRRPAARPVDLEHRVRRYLSMTGRFPRRPPSNCLERSLGAYRLLCAAAAQPEIVVGLRRGPCGVEGHVWVSVGGDAPGERPEDLATFATIVAFDASARQRTTTGFEGALADIRVR